MADFYQKEAYGNLLPNVFIEKITLENSGYYPVVDDPHIDNERETLEIQQPPDNLKIDLNLVIKQKFEDDLIGRWLLENDFKKYYKIKIFEIEDARLAGLFSMTRDVGIALDRETFFATKPAVLRLMQGFFKKTRTEMLSYIQKNVKTKEITLTNIKEKQKAQIVTETLDDGTEIINTYFNLSFEKPKSNIGHLSYYCISQLDYKAIIRDFKLKSSSKLINHLISLSTVSSEIVFDNFELKNDSFVYLDQNSKIWTGDVHQLDDGTYRTGLFETADSFTLVRRSVTNSVIQDFRRRQQIQKVSFNFDPVKRYFEKFENLNLATNNFITAKNSYFSDITITNDEDGDAKIKFALDFKGLIFENTKFSFLISRYDSRIANEVMQDTKIKSIKMYRQRVKLENANDNKVTKSRKYVKFTKDEKRKLMFHSSRHDGVIVDNKNFFLRRVNTLNSPDVLEYTGVDKSSSQLSDGTYQYSIDIQIEDPFIKYIEGFITTLRKCISFMKPYHIESEKLSLTKFFSEVLDPHIKSAKEADAKKQITEGNYNILSNTFTDTFRRKMLKKYSNLLQAPWILCNAVYVEILSVFVQNLNPDELLEQLIKFSSPQTGNPAGIANTISLMEQLVYNLSRMIDYQEMTDFLSLKTSKSRTNTTIKLEHTFENAVFDSNYTTQVMVDYLQDKRLVGQKTGLFSIQGADFVQRIERETQNYFGTTEPSITSGVNTLGTTTQLDSNQYSFLSPISLRTAKQQVVLDAPETQQKEIRTNNMIGTMKSGELSETYYNKDPKNTNINLSLFAREMQQKYNVTISQIFSLPSSIEEDEEENVSSFIDAEILETEHAVAQKISQKSSPVISDISIDDNSGLVSFLSVMQERLSNNLTMTSKKPMTTEEIKEKINLSDEQIVPNQFLSITPPASSIALPSVLPTKNLLNFTYADSKEKMVFGSTKKIMVHTGYKKGDNGKLLINEPIWVPLTKQLYLSMPRRTEMVCKLVDYSMKGIKVQDVTKQAVIVDNTFIIISDSPTVVSRQEISDNKYEISVPSPMQIIKNSNTSAKGLTLLASTKTKNIKFRITKQTLDKAVRVDQEQKAYPASLIKNAEVSKKTIEQVVSVEDVRKEISARQEELRQIKQAPPSVLPNIKNSRER